MPRFFGESVGRALRVAGHHRVERGERSRIMAVRLLEHALARLLEYQAPPERIALEDEARRAAGPVAAAARRERAGGEGAGTRERDVAEDRRMHQLVDQPHLE